MARPFVVVAAFFFVFVASALVADAEDPPQKYLIISSPSLRKIYYAVVSGPGQALEYTEENAEDPLDDESNKQQKAGGDNQMEDPTETTAAPSRPSLESPNTANAPTPTPTEGEGAQPQLDVKTSLLSHRSRGRARYRHRGQLVPSSAEGEQSKGKEADGGTGVYKSTNPMKNAVELDIAGLSDPQGVAVDNSLSPRRLFVADPMNREITSYALLRGSDGSLSVKDKRVIVHDVEVRWVAVDALHNLYFTDEVQNEIMFIDGVELLTILSSRHSAQRPFDSREFPSETVGAPARRLYAFDPSPSPDRTTAGGGVDLIPQVSQPGGIAVSAGKVIWGNKVEGTTVGSVIVGPPGLVVDGDLTKENGSHVSVLANVTDKVYGVCVACNKVFFTDGTSGRLYGTSMFGGEVVKISKSLVKPRGCVKDGDGGVFIADREANAIYRAPCGGELRPVPLELSLRGVINGGPRGEEFGDPFGLALLVISGVSRLVLLQPLFLFFLTVFVRSPLVHNL